MGKRSRAFLCVVILALCGAACTPKGELQKKVYMDSDHRSKAYIGYEFPINK